MVINGVISEDLSELRSINNWLEPHLTLIRPGFLRIVSTEGVQFDPLFIVQEEYQQNFVQLLSDIFKVS